MAGSRILSIDGEKKNLEAVLVQELQRRAVAQGITDSPTEVVIRDMLPLTDLGSATTNATSASGGYRTEEWRADLRTYQYDGSTASSAGAYNTAVNVSLNKEKVIGFIGVRKHGEDAVAAIRWGLGSGAKIKDIWQLDYVPEDGTMYAENPIIYNSTNVAKIEYYLKAVAIVNLQLLGKTAEAKGDTILGAE